MRLIIGPMIASLVHGSRRERTTAIVSLVSWFSVGAFLSSTLTYYVHAAPTEDFSALIGGVIFTTIVLMKTS